MASTETTIEERSAAPALGLDDHLALVLLWSKAEPWRAGEVALLPAEATGKRILGRGAAKADDPGERIRFARQRPGSWEPQEPLGGSSLSRVQLELTPTRAGLKAKRVGRLPLTVDGAVSDSAVLKAGNVVLLGDQLCLGCVQRSVRIPETRHFPQGAAGNFGDADRFGMVGESRCAWRWREDLAFSARSEEHVLLLGPSGAGKELAAQLVHELSPRSRGPYVARNAATLPPGLVDAELFGNIADYPNPGMPERPGLIGSAHEGSLFLDEVGELEAALQAHLLRVLDAKGEYQRLGEAQVRRSDLRLIAATNRDEDALKHDLLARFTIRVSMPGLSERLEDIPLLARHLVRRAASTSAELAERFIDPTAQHQPRLTPRLVDRLCRHEYTTHLRELNSLLWLAIRTNRDDTLDLTDELLARLGGEDDAAPPDAATIIAALERNDYNQSRAWQELGLRNRYQLIRLMQKHGIDKAP